MEFHMLLFFFLKYLHDLSTDLSKTLLFKTSFLFQNLFPFLCKATFFMSLYYSSLRILCTFKFFFYFFILFKFPIWTTIPIIKKTTKKIYFLTYSHSKNKRPVEKNLTFGIIMKHMV